jgi:hypothetical protein
MLKSSRRGGWKMPLMVLALGLGIWEMDASTAFAQRGGGHGGGFGGGGFGGGHMGGFGGGRFGGFGGFGGPGFGRRGLGFGGLGFGGFGLGGLGFGGFGFGGFSPFFGYPLYGYPYYGMGYGYGLGYGFDGLAYGGMGYGYPGYFGGLGYGGLPYGLGPGLGYGGFPAAGFGYSSAYVPPAPSLLTGQRRVLGIDEEPANLPDGRRGMRITNVYPGTAAEQAGLKVGDVLRSVNGYLTEQRGNLAWILANATSDNTLKLNVHTAADGLDHTVTATLP